VKKYTVSFVGAGRLAGVLCRELYSRGHKIELVVSQSAEKGSALAGYCRAVWSDKPVFPSSTQLIIVAVPDSKIRTVLADLQCDKSTVVAHTAGSAGIDVFPENISLKGIFYPLQSFSQGRKLNFTDLPVFLETSSAEVSEILNDIAISLGSKVYFCDAVNRSILHLAAVFANNFTNHMLTLSNDIARKAGFSFEELKPLVMETFMKAIENGPASSQTGPAVRNDENTIRKHLELLSFDHDLQKIYKELSGSISKYHNR
jgi:predicted short-subunit dehydrogenase-like oxidoreductase (DUF2520 family)